MNDHEPEFSDELISAYLDGELSPEEQALVEEQLMDSPEHRRMFEELRALRTGLQDLPQASLDDGFAARVMQRTERELQTGNSADRHDVSPGESSNHRTTQVATPRDRQDAGILRGLVWAVAAMAAAIALIVFNPIENRKVVVVEPNADQNNQAVEDSIPHATDDAAPADDNARGSDDLAASGDNGVVDVNEGSSVGSLNAAPRTMKAKPSEPVADQKEGLNRQLGNHGFGGAAGARTDLNVDELREHPNLPQTASSLHAADQPLAQNSRAGRRRGEPGLPDRADLAARSEARGLALDKVEFDSLPRGEAEQADRENVIDLVKPMARHEVQVVQVDVSAEVLASHFIDRKLRKQGIVFESASIAKASGEAKDKQDGASGQHAEFDNAHKQLRDLVQTHGDSAAFGAEAVDVVYVVAHADQVDALLTDLQASIPGQMKFRKNTQVPAAKPSPTGGPSDGAAADGVEAPQRMATFADAGQREQNGGGVDRNEAATLADRVAALESRVAEKSAATDPMPAVAKKNRAFARRIDLPKGPATASASKAELAKTQEQQQGQAVADDAVVADASADSATIAAEPQSRPPKAEGEEPEAGSAFSPPAPSSIEFASPANDHRLENKTRESDESAGRDVGDDVMLADSPSPLVRVLLVLRAVPQSTLDAETFRAKPDPAANLQPTTADRP